MKTNKDTRYKQTYCRPDYTLDRIDIWDVTETRNGEPGTGNGEQESGNERSAVFHLKIQNDGRENCPVEKRTMQVAKSTANLS